MNLLTAPFEIGIVLLQKVILAPLRPVLREIVHEEAGHYLQDIEWRYKQARDLLNEVGRPPGAYNGFSRQITAEDLNLQRHDLTGFTLTNNVNNTGAATPGSIRWQALHIVYSGTDYVIADGASLLKYNTFVFPGLTLVSSNTQPVLGKDDMVVFINNAGIGVVAGGTGAGSLPSAVADGAIDFNALAVDAVSGTKVALNGIGSGKLGTAAISASGMFATNVVQGTAIIGGAVDSTKLSTGMNNTINAKVTTFVSATAPVATAIGDIWVDTANQNVQKRATATGSGSWVSIQDGAIGAAATLAGSKATTFVSATAPAALAVGDLWVDTANNNMQKRATAIGTGGWVSIQDLGIGQAATLAGSKATTFVSATAPVALAIGDLWIDTANGNRQMRATAIGSGSWVNVQDAGITAPITATRLNILSHVLY